MRKWKRNKKVNFFRSIRFKIILAVLLPICFIIILGVVCYKKASEKIIQSYQDFSQRTVSITGEYFDFILDSTIKDYNGLFTNDQLNAYLSGTLSGFPEQMVSIYNSNRSDFIKRLTGAKFVSNIYIVSDIVDSITTTYPKGFSLYSELEKTSQGQLAASDPNSYFWFGTMPSIDDSYGTNKGEYALRLLRKFKKVDAFLAVDISKKSILDILNQLEFGDGAIWGLVTREGTEILTKGEEEFQAEESVFTKTDAFQKLLSIEENTLEQEISYQGKRYLFLGEKVSDTGLLVCVMIPMSIITSLAREIESLTVTVVCIASLIAIIVGLIISQGIDRTIQFFLYQINQAAKGDLTVKIYMKKKDEFMLLAQDLSYMIAHTKHLIQKVEEICKQLLIAAEKVTHEAKDYVISANHIKEAAEGIEMGMTEQVNDSKQCVYQMDELSGHIKQLNGDTENMEQILNKADHTIQKSLSAMSILTDKAKTTSEITETVIETMKSLEEKSEDIGGIVETIKSIAFQTNILSLNASIEAARAGEAGLGFAVVAKEIQMLAAQSSNSTKQIYDILEQIRIQMKEAAMAAKEAKGAVLDQEAAVKDTSGSFKQMKEQMEELTEAISGLIFNAKNMETARSHTMEAVENISAVSNISAQTTSNVADTAKKQFSLVSGLNDTAKQLLEYAGNLEEAVRSFKVR